MALTKREAAAELLKRRKARASIVAFAQTIQIPGVPAGGAGYRSSVMDEPEDDFEAPDWLTKGVETGVADHHALLMDTAQGLLEETLVDETGRPADGVMAFCPPGSAKSTYYDVVVPAWANGKWPGFQTLLTGYGSDMLKKHGKRCRTICSSPEYRGIFKTTVSSDTRAADEWALENGSSYQAGGILSGLTGNRADLLVNDDLIKGRRDAESPTVRESTWGAYEDDALTRLKPGGKQLFIMTRWHEDDPAGRILPAEWAGESGFIEGRDGRLWYVICLQAECERADDPLGRKKGEYLWPGWFSEKHFAPFKSNARTWRSLFQQMPTAPEGLFYKRAWFPRHMPGEVPRETNNYITLDSAETPSDEADQTFMIVWGLDEYGKSWIRDIWYGQTTTDVWVDELLDRIEYFKPLAVAPEDDNIFKAVKPFILQRMRKRDLRCPIYQMPHGGRNKELRSQAFQGLASMGDISIPDTPDGEYLLDQLLKFPSGTMDDGADTCAAWGRFADKVREAYPPKPRPQDKEVTPEQVTEIVLTDFAPKSGREGRW